MKINKARLYVIASLLFTLLFSRCTHVTSTCTFGNFAKFNVTNTDPSAVIVYYKFFFLPTGTIDPATSIQGVKFKGGSTFNQNIPNGQFCHFYVYGDEACTQILAQLIFQVGLSSQISTAVNCTYNSTSTVNASFPFNMALDQPSSGSGNKNETMRSLVMNVPDIWNQTYPPASPTDFTLTANCNVSFSQLVQYPPPPVPPATIPDYSHVYIFNSPYTTGDSPLTYLIMLNTSPGNLNLNYNFSQLQ